MKTPLSPPQPRNGINPVVQRPNNWFAMFKRQPRPLYTDSLPIPRRICTQ
jgi:hypothetical protein